jgi:autotransporter-associated beta strand protein
MTRIPGPGWSLAVLGLLVIAAPAPGQSTLTWNAAVTSNAWLDPLNWTGGPANTWPGVTATANPANGNSGDTALVGDFAFTPSSGLAIDMAAAGGELSLGALQFTGSTANLTVLNPTTTFGNLRLNGATVGGVSNVLLANTSGSRDLGVMGNLGGTGTQNLGIHLGITDGVMLVNPGRTITIGAGISEAAANSAFSVQGGGRVVLTRPNTFTGQTQVRDGELQVLPGAQLDPASRMVVGWGATNGLLTLGSAAGPVNQTLTQLARGGGTDSRVAGGSDAVSTLTLNLGTGFSHIYDGFLGGPAARQNNLALVKDGAGLMSISTSNTYTGGTTIRRGQIAIGSYSGLGPGTVTITPTGGYAELGILTSAAGSLANAIVVNPGTGEAAVGSQVISGTGVPPTVFGGPITLNGPVTLIGGNASATGVVFNGPFTGTGDVKVVFRFGSNRVVTLDRASGPANQFGNVLIDASSTLRLGVGTTSLGDRVIPDTSSITFGSGSRLELAPEGIDSESVNALHGNGVIEKVTGGSNRFTLTVGAGNGSGAFGGLIQEGSSGGQLLTLVKTGTGTQTLSGANTYGGGTTINQGTLLVTNTTGSATGDSEVTVNTGGTLGGTGRVAPPLSFSVVPTALNGGTVQAGGTATAAPKHTDVLTIAQMLRFDGTSTLRSTVGQSGGTGTAGKIDLATLGGRLARDTGGAATDVLTIRLTNDGTLDLSGTSTYTVTVLTYFTIDPGSLSEFTNQTNPAFFAVAAENFSFAGAPLISLTGGNLTVTFTPVPEPAAVLAAAAAGLGLRRLCRRLS